MKTNLFLCYNQVQFHEMFFGYQWLYVCARCLRVRQHYPAQKNNQNKMHVILKQGTTAVRRDELYSSYVGPIPRG